jgi:tetratricopeptide (TPR) repeat protein
VKQSQWTTLSVGAILTIIIFLFGRTVPSKKPIVVAPDEAVAPATDVSPIATISIESLLDKAKKQLSPEQVAHLASLENKVAYQAPDSRSRAQILGIYHQLEHFWGDSVGFFPGYAWYKAEGARLENSEKSLTFAAHLILNNIENDPNPDPALIKWKALQASDLFERSLKINPDNDSSAVGLGASILFGNTSSPMEGIKLIRGVAEKDSTNIFAQMTLVKASLLSGQFDKAITRLHTVCRIQPGNLDALLLLADLYEQTGDKAAAAATYRKSLPYIPRPNAKAEVEKRIAELGR